MPFVDPSRVKPELIRSQKVAMVGYGNQGRAQALNLRDNGVQVVIGLYDGSRSRKTAEEDGHKVELTAKAVVGADVVMMATPDMKMAEIFRSNVVAHLKPGAALLFSHGFNIHFGLIEPPKGVDVALVSPKGAGSGVRQRFVEGAGVPGLVALNQDATGKAMDRALSYAWGIGCLPNLILETTFKEETETDLFGEQAVLCGGIPELMTAAFETLVSAGYSPEMAYFECIHEAKIITDLIEARGIAGMRKAISDTAQWGGLTTGPRVVNDETRAEMRRLLSEIQSEQFAKEWVKESAGGSRKLSELRTREALHQVESVGSDVRKKLAESDKE